MATTGRSMRQTGPSAWYWRMTISVAAGAVAAAMAASVRQTGIGWPSAHSARNTHSDAMPLSRQVMTRGLTPICFR